MRATPWRGLDLCREIHSRVHDLLFGNTLLSLAKRTTVPVTLVP